MKTKMKIASVPMLVITCIGALAAAGGSVAAILKSISVWQAPALDTLNICLFILMDVLCLGMTFFFLVGMNRVCCLLWVADGILHRRGLFFGYRRSCPLEDIQRVVAVLQPRGGRFLYIEDNQEGLYQVGKKNSYIYLDDTLANRRFITDQCGRMIREIQWQDIR